MFFQGSRLEQKKNNWATVWLEGFCTKLDLLGKFKSRHKTSCFIGRLSLSGRANWAVKETNEVSGWSCQSGPISRKMTAYACVRSPFTFIFWRSDSLNSPSPRASVRPLCKHPRHSFACFSFLFQKKNWAVGNKTKSFMDSKTSFLLLLLVEQQQQQQEFARDSLFFYCRFAQSFHSLWRWRDNETKSRKDPAGTTVNPKKCFSFLFPLV